MRYLALILLSLSLSVLCGACASSGSTTAHGPRGFWKPNRTDRNGLAKGRWRTHYDDAKKQPFTSGQYRHGRPVRTFRYYAPTGALDHSEVYGRDGYCEVTYWHPNGKISSQGKAQWVTGAKGARFYWFGPWTMYAEDGQKTSVQTYTDGSLTRAETYQDGKLVKVQTFEGGRLTGTTNTL